MLGQVARTTTTKKNLGAPSSVLEGGAFDLRVRLSTLPFSCTLSLSIQTT